MHHGSQDEAEVVVTGRERIVLLDLHDLTLQVELSEELLNHRVGLCAAHNRSLRVTEQHFGKRSAVIRLHVIHYDVVERTAVQHSLDVFEEYPADCVIYGIEQDGLLVHNQVRIVGNAERNRVAVLKLSESTVAGSEIPERIAHLNCLMHNFSFSDSLQ